VRSLRRLLPYYRRYRVPFWTGLLLLVSARVFEAFIPLILKRWVDGLVDGTAALAWLAGGILACVAARYASIWVGRRYIRRVGLAVSYHLRHRLYDHLQLQGPGFFARHRSGDLMARAINDIGLVRRMVGVGTRTAFVLFFSAAVGFGFMWNESPSLTLLLLPPLPIIFLSALALSRRVHHHSLGAQEAFSDLSDRTQENLSGIRTIQALNQEGPEVRRFQAVSDDLVERYMRLIRTNSIVSVVMPALGAVATGIVLFYGGSRVLAGEISLGTFTAFLWYLNMVLWPIREAGNMINLFQRGAAGLDRLYELFESEPEIQDQPVSGAPERLGGRLELVDLDYVYPGATQPALRNVSLRVEPGETAVILGRVGAGKSTLLRVLVRLLDPPPISVFVGERDLRSLPLAQVRRDLALMPQEPFLFADTVHANLTYDDPERSSDQAWAAAHAADLGDTLASFPAGLATIVGERGVMLSGGQKQRVTLARALVRDAPFLLLDDPFSAVDSETEERILEQLRKLRPDLTTLLVTHRVSAARHADQVFVLDAGRLVESGQHRDLLAAGGFYARLAQTQLREGQLRSRLEGEERA